MKVFVSGGSKSGKSMLAQRIAKKLQANNASLYYLATMTPSDNEDYKRVLRHQQEREGWGFETIEASSRIYETIKDKDLKGVFLLDSVTALLANEMFEKNGDIHLDAYKGVLSELKKISAIAESIVIVSDYIYSDALQYDNITEKFRLGLAFIDKEIAKKSDVVLEASYGNVIIHKGENYADTINSPWNDRG